MRECSAFTLTSKENDPEVVVKFQNNFETTSGKKVSIPNRAQTNWLLSSKLLKLMSSHNVPNFSKGTGSGAELRLKRVNEVPVVFHVDNESGFSLAYFHIDESGHEKAISDDEAREFLSAGQIYELRRQCLKINVILKDFFKRRNVELLKYKLEFGAIDNKLYLATIFTMDSCDFTDLELNEKLSYSAIVKKTEKAESLFDAFIEKLNR